MSKRQRRLVASSPSTRRRGHRWVWAGLVVGIVAGSDNCGDPAATRADIGIEHIDLSSDRREHEQPEGVCTRGHGVDPRL